MYAVSPLRYPGAKWRLEKFVTALLADNGLLGAHYAEPYAGGASLALSLLVGRHVKEVHLNDLDRSIYAFWFSITRNTKNFIELARSTPVTMDSWHAQQEIQANKETASLLELGFSTFFLNRTNRSGILKGGVIGGKNQDGKWKIDARYNLENLTKRILRIAEYSSSIHVSNSDALDFVINKNKELPPSSLIFLDPPYFVKGQGLYLNSYEKEDHAAVASVVVNDLNIPWIVSYDDVPEIRNLYLGEKVHAYELRYSAASTRRGKEIIFSSPKLKIEPKFLKNA